MSVPTHNLYDFIHQVLEKKYLIKYFYPWGSKEPENVIDLIDKNNYDELENLIDLETRRLFKKGADYFGWMPFQPVLLCNDQEPLNFQLYNNSPLNLRQLKPGSYRKSWILLHSEENSRDLDLYNQSGLFKTAHWWSHAIIARDWFRYAEHDQQLQFNNSNKKFLIYARDFEGSRQYRRDFLKLIDKELCQIGSFRETNISSINSATYNAYDHTHTDASVILETVVDRIHLTEKTLRAIACGHPFLLVAGAGSLQYLRRYGFRTFSPHIDESYDNEHNLQKRMKMIAEQMKKFKYSSELKQITEYNRKHFFSKKFFNTIVNELKNNIESVHCDNLNYKLMWADRQKFCPDNDRYQNQRPYVISLIWHLKKGGTLEDYVPPDLE